MRTLKSAFPATVAALAGAALLARGIAGPNPLVRNPLGAEITLALAVITGLLLWRCRTETAAARPSNWIAPAGIAVAAVIAFLPVLSMPLVTDDYIHLRQIADGEAPTAAGCLTHSCGGPQFYRPLGFSTYWAEWELWGTAAFPRHAADVGLHAICCVLFLVLVRRLGIGSPYDWLAGLIFAWNSIRPEAVAWTAARFDTLALLFSLVAAVSALRLDRIGAAVTMLATAAACLSKESAYVLPLLIAILLGRRALAGAGRATVIASFGTAVALFAWRWVVLKGVGGYVAPDGASPSALYLNPLVFVKTFFARIWGILWFPLNWSRPFEWWMAAGLAAGIAASLLLLRARPDRGRVVLCLAGVAVAALPVHHMLLIDPSLERSRYLDLATPAFTLLVAFAGMALPRRLGIGTLSLFAVFHLAGLQHNLRIWSDVSRARYQLCREVADQVRDSGAPVTLTNVPLAKDGVYWRNGIEDCANLEFNIPMGRVRVNPPGS